MIVLADKPAQVQTVPTKKGTYKVLHLSDIHIDLNYMEGTNAFCNED